MAKMLITIGLAFVAIGLVLMLGERLGIVIGPERVARVEC